MVEKILQNREKLATYVYAVAMALYFFILTIGNTAFIIRNATPLSGLLLKLIEAGAMGLLCLRVILMPPIKDKKRLIALCIMTVAFLVSGIVIGHKFFVFTALILVSTVDMNAKLVMKIPLIIQGSLLVLITVLAEVGILENYNFVSFDRYRYALGFSWTTIPTIMFFFLMLCYISIRADKYRWYESVILLAISCYFYIRTRTRMTFALELVAIVAFTALTLFPIIEKLLYKIRYVIIAVPLLSTIVAFVSAWLYNPEKAYWVKANNILSNRLILAQDALREYKVTLWGQAIEWIGSGLANGGYPEDYNYVDSSYIQLFITYGLISFIIIIGFYTVGIWKAVKLNNWWIAIALVFVLLHSLTEPHLLNFAENPLILLPFAVMAPGGNYVQKEKLRLD